MSVCIVSERQASAGYGLGAASTLYSAHFLSAIEVADMTSPRWVCAYGIVVAQCAARWCFLPGRRDDAGHGAREFSPHLGLSTGADMALHERPQRPGEPIEPYDTP